MTTRDFLVVWRYATNDPEYAREASEVWRVHATSAEEAATYVRTENLSTINVISSNPAPLNDHEIRDAMARLAARLEKKS